MKEKHTLNVLHKMNITLYCLEFSPCSTQKSTSHDDDDDDGVIHKSIINMIVGVMSVFSD